MAHCQASVPRCGLAAALFFAGVSAALAGVVETAACRHDLPAAGEAISRVSSRDRAGRAAPPAPAAMCQTLRANLADMRVARDIMARCLTGHERGENVAQLDVSIVDVSAIISRRCN